MFGLKAKQKQQKQKVKSPSFFDNGTEGLEGPSTAGGAERILQSESDRNLPPCAVIVTLLGGSSFDDLYRHSPQVSPDPTQTVALFEVHFSTLNEVLDALRGNRNAESPYAAVINDIIDCMAQVDPESVVFNFECCSCCSSSGFGHDPQIIIPLVASLVDRQHIVVFGDFSLKGLIHDWNEELLGPNPFINCGETSTSLNLKFNPEVLAECCNAQLQNVGKMCESGEAVVNVMAGTIVFNVSPEKSDTDRYSTEILTRCVNSVGGETCGHVMLTYPSGGRILVSAGHWIELSHLSGATEESVLRMCSAQMGQEKANLMMAELGSAQNAYERERVVQKNAQEVVWSSSPCLYTKKAS